MTAWKEVMWKNLPHVVYAIRREQATGKS